MKDTMLDTTPCNVYEVEYTDTFGGEANYSWVRRHLIRLPMTDAEGREARARYDRRLRRIAKATMGLTGHPGRWEEIGGDLAFYPRGMCRVMLVTWREE
jgi:hypothetical protein